MVGVFGYVDLLIGFNVFVYIMATSKQSRNIIEEGDSNWLNIGWHAGGRQRETKYQGKCID